MKLERAPADRAWMDATDRQFANRCLPLRIANQAGWVLLNPFRFRAVWWGSDDTDSVEIRYADNRCVSSHFGHGILTWEIPYLFRTPPGYNLVVRGLTNYFKDGIIPLDGIVEADWSIATFTMNWKFTRPGHWVTFDRDEPICMLYPQARDELERFQPKTAFVSADPQLEERVCAWIKGREEHNAMLRACPHISSNKGWQKHYFLGTTPAGESFADHRVKLNLKPFIGDNLFKESTSSMRHGEQCSIPVRTQMRERLLYPLRRLINWAYS